MGLALAGAALAAAAIGFTLYRIHLGMDLQDESFYVLIPWRWALGDRPFVDEQNLAQVSAYLTYPFIKLFALLRDNDATGLILYTRYIYVLFTLAVAASVFWALRAVLRWPLALAVAAVYVTFIFIAIPQLSYNTMGAGFLTMGFAFGLQVVLSHRGMRWAAAAGAAHGLAVVAYPTLLFIMPFCAMFLAFSLGRRSVGVIERLSLAELPERGGPATGRTARSAVLAYVAGGAAVVAVAALVTISFGIGNLQRAWDFQMMVAQQSTQLGGAGKAALAAQGVWRLFTAHPLLIVAALAAYVVYRRWPRLGRALLLALPAALWLAGQQPLLNAQGFVIVYGLIAPYLFLFVPLARRADGARLLIWVWAPSAIAGAMTAYTSASGYVNGPAGLAPAMLVSGTCLAWALEAIVVTDAEPDAAPGGSAAEEEAPGRPEAAQSEVPSPDVGREEAPGRPLAEPAAAPSRSSSSRGAWIALAGLAAIVAVTVVFQFQFQERDARYSELTHRLDWGPWKGIAVTPGRAERLRSFADGLEQEGRPGDRLLVFYQACGFYFFWSQKIAANTVWLSDADPMADLSQGAFAYYRRYGIVPTLIAHIIDTKGLTARQLQEGSGGFDYPTVLIRPGYALNRKPDDETVDQVLDRLPRESENAW